MIFEKNVSIMTDEEILEAMKTLETEQRKRDAQLRTKTIDEFEKAFRKLRKLGIVVKYVDEDPYENPMYLYNLDNFEYD